MEISLHCVFTFIQNHTNIKILELSATTYKIVRISSAEKDAYNSTKSIESTEQSSVYTTENSDKSDSPNKASYSVFASSDSNLYHKSNCSKLNTKDLIEFSSPKKARKSGGAPCSNCNP